MNLDARPASHRLRGRVRDYVLYVAITFALLGMVFVVQTVEASNPPFFGAISL
jgi:hypothetical protein